MISPKTAKQPQPMIAPVSKNATSNVATMPSTTPELVPPQERIRERAYELYESRGRQAGRDEQDWLSAEQEILQRRR